MNNQVEKLIAIARAEVGYLEKATHAQLDDKKSNAGAGNYTKYWRDLHNPLQGHPWCACFIIWCARKANISQTIIPTFYDCDVGMTWYKSQKQWIANPQPGDIIFFGKQGDAQHVGIATEVNGDRIYTIEGNTSSGSTMVANGGSVAAKNYALNYNKILGYGRPKYIQEDEEVTQEQFDKMMEVYLTKRAKSASKYPDLHAQAKALGITDGSRPYDFATREEAAIMAHRAALKK